MATGSLLALLDDIATILDDVAAMSVERGPLVLSDDRVLVRWMPTAPDSALRPLDEYLAERLDLALLGLEL
mgnify:CR=1 FL=1